MFWRIQLSFWKGVQPLRNPRKTFLFTGTEGIFHSEFCYVIDFTNCYNYVFKVRFSSSSFSSDCINLYSFIIIIYFLDFVFLTLWYRWGFFIFFLREKEKLFGHDRSIIPQVVNFLSLSRPYVEKFFMGVFFFFSDKSVAAILFRKLFGIYFYCL